MGKKLGLEVEIWNDLNAMDMEIKLKAVAKENHSEANSFVCVIMSHGYEGAVRSSDGCVIELDKIFNMFNGDKCPTLVGKPKTFFIQDVGLSGMSSTARGSFKRLLKFWEKMQTRWT